MKALLFALPILFIPPCYAECRQDAAVAVEFMNQYLAYDRAIYEKRTTQPTVEWLKANSLVSHSFPKSYEATVLAGFKIDPELGLNADPILDAQDSPDIGFKLLKCSRTPGYVMLQGTDWPEFRVTVSVIRTSKGLKVNGAGMVNIPKIERASR
jgi:hypothetical protein